MGNNDVDFNNIGSVNVTFRVDADCQVLCDGEFFFLLNSNQIVKEKLPAGEHFLQFVSLDDPEINIERKVDFSRVGFNYLILVDEFKTIEAEKKAQIQAAAEAKALRESEEKERLRTVAEAEAKAELEARLRDEAEAEERIMKVVAEARAIEKARVRAEAEAEARAKAEEETKKRVEAEVRAREEAIPRTIRIQCSDGSGGRYEGLVKDGHPNGKGTAYYDNGDVYVGDWQQGIRHGYGSYTWADGRKYEGEWKDDFQSGYGVFHYLAVAGRVKITYEGEWKDGNFNGQGLIIYGDYYRVMANWKDGQIKGSFRRYKKDGTFEDCEGGWVNIHGGVTREGKATASTGSVNLYKNDELLISGGQSGFFYKLDYLHAIVYYKEDYGGEKVPIVYRDAVYIDYQTVADMFERLSDYDDAKRYGCISTIMTPPSHFPSEVTAKTPYLYLLYKNTHQISSARNKERIIIELRRLLNDSHRNRGDYSYSAIKDIPDYFDDDYYMDGHIRYSILKVIVKDLPDYFIKQ